MSKMLGRGRASLLILALLQPMVLDGRVAQVVRISVIDAAGSRAIKAARVFVLSTEGKELASTTTNDRGIAELPVLQSSQHPRYIVVERDGYYLSGMRWRAGFEEYYIVMTVLRVT